MHLPILFSRKLWLICAVIGLSAPVGAAQPYQPIESDPFFEPWRFRSFPELEGRGARCMVEDWHGDMWFGAAGRVIRFDGVKWTFYRVEDGLLPGAILSISATSQGDIYAGSTQGLSRFSKGVWRTVLGGDKGLPVRIHSLVVDAQDVVWAGSYYGIFRIDKDDVVLYTTSELEKNFRRLAPHIQTQQLPASALLRTSGNRAGALLSGGLENQVFLDRPPVVIQSTIPNGVADRAGLRPGDRLMNVKGRDFLQDIEDETILQVLRPGREQVFDVRIEPEEASGTFSSFSVFSLTLAHDGSLWVGLDTGEIAHLVFEAKQIRSARLYTDQAGFQPAISPRMLARKNGELWVISEAHSTGVLVFDSTAWREIRLDDLGGTHYHTSILETKDGSVCVGGLRTFSVFKNDKWKVYDGGSLNLPNERPRMLETSNGALWFLGLGKFGVRVDNLTNRWKTWEDLAFQTETLDGTYWFLTRDGKAVSKQGETWQAYGLNDGMMTEPVGMIFRAPNQLFVVGTDNGHAATAWLDGERWRVIHHPKLGWGVDARCIVGPDGTLWAGSQSDLYVERGQLGGILRLQPDADPMSGWEHLKPPDAPLAAYGIGQTLDGALWVGFYGGLRKYDGQTWSVVSHPHLGDLPIDAISSNAQGDLWIGTRAHGLYHLNNGRWEQHSIEQGLLDNTVRSVLSRNGGPVIVSTIKGISGLSQGQWAGHVFPESFRPIKMRETSDGYVWLIEYGINWRVRARHRTAKQKDVFRTIRYRPDREAPVTYITTGLKDVSSDGNTFMTWRGTDQWRITHEEDLEYAWRLNGGDWSRFSHKMENVFLGLDSGDYTFEVKARDKGLNESQEAVLLFSVASPIWQQFWFLGLIFIFIGLIAAQTTRAIRRGKSLEASHADLQEKEKQLQVYAEKFEHDLKDRTRELQCLYSLSTVTEQPNLTFETLFKNAVALIPSGWQYGDRACARISYEDRTFTTEIFDETGWKLTSPIPVRNAVMGHVDLFYLEAFPESDEGPFKKEERDLLNAIAERLGGSVEKLQREHDLDERMKELRCLYDVSEITEQPDVSLKEIFQAAVDRVPAGWQYPDRTCAQIQYGDQLFHSDKFQGTEWELAAPIKDDGNTVGHIRIFYLSSMPIRDFGPFLKEERDLLDAVADRLGAVVGKRQADAKLHEYQEHLESQVAQRTAELGKMHQVSLARAEAEVSLGNLATRLQGKRTVEDVSDSILSAVVDFLGAPVGAVYVLESDGYLRRQAGHALPPGSDDMDIFALGSGSIGQVAQLRKASSFNPGMGSFPIAYGFGQATARQIITCPMIASDILVGVIELCCVEKLDDQQWQWLEKAMALSATALRFAEENQEHRQAEKALQNEYQENPLLSSDN
ncbi:MAG: ligand-binding sensor domain-containing protein/GAF domain-containing protein [Candidatus Latescibacterota bacterium]|jgi:ligand-binding sensor domain-containing protein/GAF domain-containing protein